MFTICFRDMSAKGIDLAITLNSIMNSIALHETAISKMLNVSGKTLQDIALDANPMSDGFSERYPGGAADALSDINKTNQSVKHMADILNATESALMRKLCCVLRFLSPSVSVDME